ncbi:MAG: hypothetical protein ACYCV7_09765 [Acidimicrobiales bacterium]
MNSLFRSRVLAVASVLTMASVAVACGHATPSPSAPTSPTASVLGASYAKSLGFSKTVAAPKAVSDSKQPNCPKSVESAYEDGAGKTWLVSETLLCSSKAAAAVAFGDVTKHMARDTAVAAPKALGSSVLITATGAPQYTIIWQHGTRVGLTALNVDVHPAASTSTHAAASSLTTKEAGILSAAAVAQNNLYG